MRRFLVELREGLLLRAETMALFAGSMIIGMNTSGLLMWLGVSEKAASGLGFVVWVTLFWMLAIWWMYIALMRDGLLGGRPRTDEGDRE